MKLFHSSVNVYQRVDQQVAHPSHFGEIHQSATSPQGLQSHFQRWIAAAGFVDLVETTELRGKPRWG